MVALVEYDPVRRRLWVCRGRVHHGLMGALLVAFGVGLIVDDWHDRQLWFRLSDGPATSPGLTSLG